jgi:hypothetical protein
MIATPAAFLKVVVAGYCPGASMLISRYAKVLLQTPGTGSLLLCVIGLSVGGAVLAEWSHSAGTVPAVSRQSAVRTPAPSKSASRSTASVESLSQTVKVASVGAMQKVSMPETSATVRVSAKTSGPHLERGVFHEPIATEQLGVLNDYAGRPAKEALQQSKVREVMSEFVPYAPFHLGLDMPLPTAIEAVLLRSSLPIGIRDGRYMMLATGSGSTRGFVWIDLQQGIAVGGIFFHPRNGEPTPTLTLFSKQVKQGSLKMSQLPVAFAEDLSRWTVMAGIPPVTTRYFINGSGEKLVLTHDEDYCKQPLGTLYASTADCRQMKEEAAELDTRAASFLGETHYASNATMHMVAAQSSDELLTR